MIRGFVYPVVVILQMLHCEAQNLLKPGFAEIYFNSGYLIKNHAEFPEVNSASLGGTLRIGGKLNGSKPWHRCFSYPDFSVSAMYGSLGNNKVLGNFSALLPEISFRKKLNGKWSMSKTFGLGIAYFNNPYRQVSNSENIAIGSHITFCASAAVAFEYRVKNNLGISIQPGIYHASNSHTSLPNAGMNLPLAGIGLKYFPSAEPEIIHRDSILPFSKRIHINFRAGIGINEQGGATGPARGPKYPIYITSVFLSKNLTPVNKIIAGVEGWYNTGVYDYITAEDFFYSHQKRNSMVAALLFGHEFLMGHIGISTQIGFNFYNPFYRKKIKLDENASFRDMLKSYIPTRIGYNYYFSDATKKQRKNFYFGIYIKANISQADFLDTAFGYTF